MLVAEAALVAEVVADAVAVLEAVEGPVDRDGRSEPDSQIPRAVARMRSDRRSSIRYRHQKWVT